MIYAVLLYLKRASLSELVTALIMRFLQCLPFVGVLLGLLTTSYGIPDGSVEQLFSANGTAGDHTNNWAVLVCASRFWFNYRVSDCSILIIDF